MRKRAFAGAFILTLALGTFAAPVAVADEGPMKPTVSFWAGIEAWFQDLLEGWFGAETFDAAYKADEDPPPSGPVPPGAQDGGGSGTSTTDGGVVGDPDG